MTLRNEKPHVNKCFPRIRGDVPAGCNPSIYRIRFSPHTRGCSCRPRQPPKSADVFPAYAGMFLNAQPQLAREVGFPRIRGDVPSQSSSQSQECTFSPHTRGCSVRALAKRARGDVFPAYAGMFPVSTAAFHARNGFPRIRGDVPMTIIIPHFHAGFSPHTRGCSGCCGDVHGAV